MSVNNKPEITEHDKTPYTKITFIPDLKRFKLDKLTDDIKNLFEKRVYDMCAWTDSDISTSFNNKKLKIKDFDK